MSFIYLLGRTSGRNDVSWNYRKNQDLSEASMISKMATLAELEGMRGTAS